MGTPCLAYLHTHRVIVQWRTIFQLQYSLKKGFRFKMGSNGGWAGPVVGWEPPADLSKRHLHCGWLCRLCIPVCLQLLVDYWLFQSQWHPTTNHQNNQNSNVHNGHIELPAPNQRRPCQIGLRRSRQRQSYVFIFL